MTVTASCIDRSGLVTGALTKAARHHKIPRSYIHMHLVFVESTSDGCLICRGVRNLMTARARHQEWTELSNGHFARWHSEKLDLEYQPIRTRLRVRQGIAPKCAGERNFEGDKYSRIIQVPRPPFGSSVSSPSAPLHFPFQHLCHYNLNYDNCHRIAGAANLESS